MIMYISWIDLHALCSMVYGCEGRSDNDSSSSGTVDLVLVMDISYIFM